MKTASILAAAVATLLTALATPAFAEGTAPSPEEAGKVTAYYFDGKEAGPVLVKTLACLKVEQKDPKTKNECVEPVGGPVPKGTEVHAWMQWLVPVGGKYDDVSVQFLLDGAVRETKDVPAMNEAIRFRTWASTSVTKAGKWTIKVQRGGKDLASVDFDVK